MYLYTRFSFSGIRIKESLNNGYYTLRGLIRNYVFWFNSMMLFFLFKNIIIFYLNYTYDIIILFINICGILSVTEKPKTKNLAFC
ncbi:MAG: hypothetical protein CV087_13480 [Candidatus Brocadia sp. WS118]|nr:MAG: hypothetical protein CV087_13480 [Candidatus Brocadia sp. WS118]